MFVLPPRPCRWVNSIKPPDGSAHMLSDWRQVFALVWDYRILVNPCWIKASSVTNTMSWFLFILLPALKQPHILLFYIFFYLFFKLTEPKVLIAELMQSGIVIIFILFSFEILDFGLKSKETMFNLNQRLFKIKKIFFLTRKSQTEAPNFPREIIFC